MLMLMNGWMISDIAVIGIARSYRHTPLSQDTCDRPLHTASCMPFFYQIPYGCAVVVDRMVDDGSSLNLAVMIKVEHEQVRSLLLGPGMPMISRPPSQYGEDGCGKTSALRELGIFALRKALEMEKEMEIWENTKNGGKPKNLCHFYLPALSGITTDRKEKGKNTIAL